MPKSPAIATISKRLAETRRRQVQTLLEAAKVDKSWNAVASLVLQLRKADEVVALATAAEEASKDSSTALTPAESAARLEELVMQAPLKVHARIFKRLLEAHPDWLEEDSWSEV